MTAGPLPREVVLVGGGHAHAEVLRRWALDTPPDVRLTVVTDTPVALYSGMVPGVVARHYRIEDIAIDVAALAQRAGARLVLSPLTGIDVGKRCVIVQGGLPLRYDVASLNIGSIPAGLEVPGVRVYALPVRPLGPFVDRVGMLAPHGPGIVVVGGGAGGVELAFALRERLPAGTVTGGSPPPAGPSRAPCCAGGPPGPRGGGRDPRGIPGGGRGRWTPAARGRVLASLRIAGLGDGRSGHRVLRDAGLPVDDRGFVLTGPSLLVQGRDDLFAVGDCATQESHPQTPKAGVFAVRQGPFLHSNLRALLAGTPLRTFQPQRHFLTLLNLGRGVGGGSKWGLAARGKWVMMLKDWIDRRFIRRYRLAASPSP